MNQFSIKEVEALTGIKPHTLRIWEQRYDLLKPKRTATNIRYYDDVDLKSLLNISLLNNHGIKISKIAKLSQKEIDEIILEFSSNKEDHSFQVHALIGYMLSLDDAMFEQILQNNFTMHGIVKTMEELIWPFLSHIGILWLSGAVNPAYEHFITNIISSKLIVATDQLGYNRKTNLPQKKYLLFLPEGETHEIGLLFANFYFRSVGHHTLFLGQNLPVEELDIICKTYQPDFIFTSITAALNPKKLKQFFETLSSADFKWPVLFTGRVANDPNIKMPKNFHVIQKTSDLDSFI